jgi:hypothetical protein
VSNTFLADAVAHNPRIGLVILNISHSEQLAEAIAHRANTAVVAHWQPVLGDHMTAFTRAFYTRLGEGLPADVAITEARRALDRRFPGERAWASTVLLTCWPPPAMTVSKSTEDVDMAEPAQPDHSTSDRLAELLHRTNLERARQLLEVARWQPIEAQVAEAERRLAELRGTETT